jgi:drug/metabolite transporter (DMT)-like permease
MIALFVLVRIIANPLSNVYQKQLTQQSADPVFIIWAVHTGLAIACVLGAAVAAVAIVALQGRHPLPQQVRILRCETRTYVRLAITTGLMQFATVLTFGTLQVGYSLALFQLSALISVFLGYRYFHEEQMPTRVVGSLVMTAGAAVIVTFGGPG